MVDAGLSCKRIEAEMEKIGQDMGALDAILVTHEHGDHISGVGVISRKYDVPIYANAPTWQEMADRIGDIASKNLRTIDQNDFYIEDMCVQPFEIPHDAALPYGYSVSNGGKKVSVMTDLGRVSNALLEIVADSSIVLLEANHDTEMLKCGPYPYYLKRRILSSKGHLSNEDAGNAALKLAASGVRGILLGHLSEKNNFYELAYETVYAHLQQNGVEPGKHVAIGLAKQEGVTGHYEA